MRGLLLGWAEVRGGRREKKKRRSGNMVGGDGVVVVRVVVGRGEWAWAREGFACLCTPRQ